MLCAEPRQWQGTHEGPATCVKTDSGKGTKLYASATAAPRLVAPVATGYGLEGARADAVDRPHEADVAESRRQRPEAPIRVGWNSDQPAP